MGKIVDKIANKYAEDPNVIVTFSVDTLRELIDEIQSRVGVPNPQDFIIRRIPGEGTFFWLRPTDSDGCPFDIYIRAEILFETSTISEGGASYDIQAHEPPYTVRIHVWSSSTVAGVDPYTYQIDCVLADADKYTFTPPDAYVNYLSSDPPTPSFDPIYFFEDKSVDCPDWPFNICATALDGGTLLDQCKSIVGPIQLPSTIDKCFEASLYINTGTDPAIVWTTIFLNHAFAATADVDEFDDDGDGGDCEYFVWDWFFEVTVGNSYFEISGGFYPELGGSVGEIYEETGGVFQGIWEIGLGSPTGPGVYFDGEVTFPPPDFSEVWEPSTIPAFRLVITEVECP